MKIFRSVLLIFSLFLSMSFYGQTDDSLQNINSVLYFSDSYSIDQPIGLEKLNVQEEMPSLVLYNRTTNSYDTYLSNNGSYSYIGSNTHFKNNSNFFTNLFLGNNSFSESNSLLPKSSLLLKEGGSYIVRDSFNPNGASNFSEAVLGGVLGLLFN